MDESELISRFGMQPIPHEGGMFRRLWSSDRDGGDGRSAGTAIVALVSTGTASFSAMHRLPVDETWHFYTGDALQLCLLHPDGSAEILIIGDDIAAGQAFVHTVPAGTWMGARVAPGGAWSLFGCTMAPGFVPADYEGGTYRDLAAKYPAVADTIRALTRD